MTKRSYRSSSFPPTFIDKGGVVLTFGDSLDVAAIDRIELGERAADRLESLDGSVRIAIPRSHVMVSFPIAQSFHTEIETRSVSTGRKPGPRNPARHLRSESRKTAASPFWIAFFKAARANQSLKIPATESPCFLLWLEMMARKSRINSTVSTCSRESCNWARIASSRGIGNHEHFLAGSRSQLGEKVLGGIVVLQHRPARTGTSIFGIYSEGKCSRRASSFRWSRGF